MQSEDRHTLSDAIADLRRSSGLDPASASARNWSVVLGPMTLTLPNFHWRRRAIFVHDLHHILTGYPCTMRGEFQLAVWEFAAGRFPHVAATLFCLPLVAMGFLWSPRPIDRAAAVGRYMDWSPATIFYGGPWPRFETIIARYRKVAPVFAKLQNSACCCCKHCS